MTNEKRDNAIISKTGIINGRGSDIYKWVSYLSDVERAHVREGGLVLVRDTCKHHMTTDYKRVTFYSGKYYHRNYYGQVAS